MEHITRPPLLTRIVNSIFTSNTYLIQQEKNAYIIDIGDVAPLFSSGLTCKGLFITHAHFDHIYGIEAFHSKYPQCPIYASISGKQYLANEKMNMSRYHGSPINFIGDIETLQEGDIVTLFPELLLYTYETPGHNPSCLTYKVGDYLFTGDAFIPGLKVNTILPRANNEEAEMSFQRIGQMISNETLICAGHGDIVEGKSLI